MSWYIRVMKTNLMHLFIHCLFHQSTSTCFGHICSPSSGGILYIHNNWYVLCFLVDCLLANRQSTWGGGGKYQFCVCVCVRVCIYRVSQDECARLREGVPYVKVYRYNPKHLCPKLNGYGDNGQRRVWTSCGSTHCTCQLTILSISVLECGVIWRQFSSR